jgi:flavorubredoxin
MDTTTEIQEIKERLSHIETILFGEPLPDIDDLLKSIESETDPDRKAGLLSMKNPL